MPKIDEQNFIISIIHMFNHLQVAAISIMGPEEVAPVVAMVAVTIVRTAKITLVLIGGGLTTKQGTKSQEHKKKRNKNKNPHIKLHTITNTYNQ